MTQLAWRIRCSLGQVCRTGAPEGGNGGCDESGVHVDEQDHIFCDLVGDSEGEEIIQKCPEVSGPVVISMK